MMKSAQLVHWAEQFNKTRVLVVGDIMLDRFITGSVSRISPEAPVPVLHYRETKSALGGAGNVVRNLQALGSYASFVSAVGDDDEGREIEEKLSNYDGMQLSLIREQGRNTTVKTRYIAERQQILRVDRETIRPLESNSREKALRYIFEYLDNCDVVVLSDYAKGFLCPELIHRILKASKVKNKPVIVDPKGKDYTRYRGATILTPNLKELSESTNLPVDGEEKIIAASRELIKSCELNAVLATRSQDGMSLIEASGNVIHLNADAKEVFDVSGAGDTVIAVLAAAFGAGASFREAAELANIAAGIVVSKVGTAVTYAKDLIGALHHQELSRAEARVLDLDVAVDRVDLWRRKGYKIGFTNGVFDLLHPGHVRLLTQAAETCDRLIVGLNGDESVRCLQGKGPVQHEAARSTILASFEAVDMVVVFQDETPMRLLRALKPEVLIKGSNYELEEVVGADLVKSYGGSVVLVDINGSYSPDSTIVKMTNGIL